MNIKDFVYKLTKWVVTDFPGKIQVFKYPFFFVVGPTSYKLRGDDQRKILDQLQPADILLRRFNAYLTSKFIPGYWTHAGIYVGNNKVVHATTHDGVVQEDILQFLRADELIILRIKNLTGIDRDAMLKKANESVGRKYDFGFDFNNSKKLSCSELIYYCTYSIFPEIKFKRTNTLLYKDVITPDSLTEIGFEVVDTVHPS